MIADGRVSRLLGVRRSSSPCAGVCGDRPGSSPFPNSSSRCFRIGNAITVVVRRPDPPGPAVPRVSSRGINIGTSPFVFEEPRSTIASTAEHARWSFTSRRSRFQPVCLVGAAPRTARIHSMVRTGYSPSKTGPQRVRLRRRLHRPQGGARCSACCAPRRPWAIRGQSPVFWSRPNDRRRPCYASSRSTRCGAASISHRRSGSATPPSVVYGRSGAATSRPLLARRLCAAERVPTTCSCAWPPGLVSMWTDAARPRHPGASAPHRLFASVVQLPRRVALTGPGWRSRPSPTSRVAARPKLPQRRRSGQQGDARPSTYGASPLPSSSGPVTATARSP